jgi:hypothetical protein
MKTNSAFERAAGNASFARNTTRRRRRLPIVKDTDRGTAREHVFIAGGFVNLFHGLNFSAVP